MGSRFWQTLLAGGLCAFVNTASATMVPTTFAAENIQGDGGDRSLVVGPVWYFFHDGSFDSFDAGIRPSSGLQRIVHVGYGGLMRDEFLAAHPDGAFFGVTHGVANQNPELLEFHVRQQELDPVKHRYMSYVARVVPSDDAFVGNDNPRAHEVFDEKGAFQGPIVFELTGASILDAGTRLNDETNIAGFDELGGTDNGIATDEVIREHPGFNGSWGNPSGQPRRILGGVLQYYPGLEEEHHRVDAVLGDFTRPDFRLNRFRLSSRLSSYFSGAWYDPARSGEGFTIAIFDAVAPKLALSWYTYAADDSGRQKWLYGIGTIDDIDATMELFETEGGRMGSTENPQRVVTKRWGTARVGYANCDAGAVIVEPDDASLPRGAIPIRRATALAAGTERDCGLGTLSPGIPAPPPF